jgi:hypothetical protein
MRQPARRPFALAALVALACGALGGCGLGRGADDHGRVAPHFEPGFNLLSVEQDVEVGRKSAAEVAAQMPVVDDATVSAYVSDLGARLAAHAPGAKYPYEFHVVNVKELNAFALPGGFVFVNRGTLEAVTDEGELAGVMAHEISHVALRHGTSQMSKAYIAQAGLGILQRILGGGAGDGTTHVGDVVAAVGGLGLNTLFLKFGRTAESQADLTGAQIMADAGYDPVDMERFFETLAEQGGQGVPEFLSDHPDPGDRARALEEVRRSIRVKPDANRNADAFRRMKAGLRALAPAASMRAAEIGPSGGGDGDGGGGARPEPPAGEMQSYRAPTGAYEVSYPANWEALSDRADDSAFSPRGGYGKLDDALVFTHGVLVGVVDANGEDLEASTRRFVEAQLRANPDFQVAGELRQTALDGRAALGVQLAGPSPVTGRLEVDVVYTTMLGDGRMFYAIAVAPRDEMSAYQPAFERVVGSIRLAG